VNVAKLPAQIDGDEIPSVTVGLGLTRRFIVWFVRQPKALIPVTVYDVVTDGFTVKDGAAIFAGLQVWLIPPLTLSVAIFPGQMEVGLATVARVGPVFTRMPTVAEPEHPEALPETV
jgi:hypothetical protein